VILISRLTLSIITTFTAYACKQLNHSFTTPLLPSQNNDSAIALKVLTTFTIKRNDAFTDLEAAEALRDRRNVK